MKTTVILALLFLGLRSFAAPNENTNQNISRNGQSPLELTVQLTKNMYRQQPYDAHYTVQVPYQDTESYLDTETSYENQYICRNRTEYEQRCHMNDGCDSVSDFTPMFNIKDFGDITTFGHVPAPGGGGGGGDDERPSRPPPGGGGDERPSRPPPPQHQCHPHQECENVPVTRQECGYEQVVVTHTVTKYRPVTRYRDEDRCCVTKYQDIFDHQEQLRVDIVFPQGSELQANEEEQLSVEMNSATDASLSFDNTIFAYEIVSKKVSNGVVTFVLKTVPKFSEKELGLSSVIGLNLLEDGKNSRVSFIDTGLRPRVQTQYSWEVIEQESNTQVAQGSFVSSGVKEISLPVSAKFNIERTYVFNVNVIREGVVLAAPIKFQAQIINARTPADPAKITNADLVSSPAIRATGSGSIALTLSDALPNFEEVSTTYKIKIERDSGFLGLGSSLLVEKTFSKPRTDNVNFAFDFQRDLGISDSDMKDFVKSGKTLYLTVVISRYSPLVNAGKAVQFQKTAKMDVP